MSDRVSLRNALKIAARNAFVYKRNYLMGIPPTLFEPVMYFAALSIFVATGDRQLTGMSYLKFLAPGLVVISCVFSASIEAAVCSYIRREFQKTFAGIIATSVNAEDVALGEIIWAAFKGTVFGAFVAAVFALGGIIPPAGALLLPVVLFPAGLLFSAAAMICAAHIRNFEDSQYYFTFVLVPLVFLSGIFFPLERLPGILRAAALFSPLNQCVAMARDAAAGDLSGHFLLNGCAVIALTGIVMPVPIWMLKRRLVG